MSYGNHTDLLSCGRTGRRMSRVHIIASTDRPKWGVSYRAVCGTIVRTARGTVPEDINCPRCRGWWKSRELSRAIDRELEESSHSGDGES